METFRTEYGVQKTQHASRIKETALMLLGRKGTWKGRPKFLGTQGELGHPTFSFPYERYSLDGSVI